MARRDSKNIIRLRVHKRIRSRVSGTGERPRLAVFRSVKHIYAQIIDDTTGKTLLSVNSDQKEPGLKHGGNISAAKAIGKAVAAKRIYGSRLEHAGTNARQHMLAAGPFQHDAGDAALMEHFREEHARRAAADDGNLGPHLGQRPCGDPLPRPV